MELSDDSKKVLREIIERQDKDENGWFDAKEFRKVLVNMGFRPSHEDVDFLMKHLDTSGDGKLQVDEVMDSLDVINAHSLNGGEMMEAFKLFDLKGDGCIRAYELKIVLTMKGPNQLTSEDADALIEDLLKNYDTNNDKKFSYGEFVHMFMDDAVTIPEPATPDPKSPKKKKGKKTKTQ